MRWGMREREGKKEREKERGRESGGRVGERAVGGELIKISERGWFQNLLIFLTLCQSLSNQV